MEKHGPEYSISSILVKLEPQDSIKESLSDNEKIGMMEDILNDLELESSFTISANKDFHYNKKRIVISLNGDIEKNFSTILLHLDRIFTVTKFRFVGLSYMSLIEGWGEESSYSSSYSKLANLSKDDIKKITKISINLLDIST